MSLIIARKWDNALSLCVDTLASPMDGQASPANGVDEAMKLLRGGLHAPKMAHLPHINAIAAHRGDALLANIVVSALFIGMPQSFDDAVKAMPEIQAHAYAQATAHRKQQFGIEHFHGSELFLFGWSDALNRMEGVRWVRWPHDKGFNASPVNNPLILPDAEWEHTPPAETPEQFERIARDQVAYVRRKHPGYNCGGRLLLAELTRDTLSIRTIADLETDSTGHTAA
jgi:hypothetical protein